MISVRFRARNRRAPTPSGTPPCRCARGICTPTGRNVADEGVNATRAGVARGFGGPGGRCTGLFAPRGGYCAGPAGPVSTLSVPMCPGFGTYWGASRRCAGILTINQRGTVVLRADRMGVRGPLGLGCGRGGQVPGQARHAVCRDRGDRHMRGMRGRGDRVTPWRSLARAPEVIRGRWIRVARERTAPRAPCAANPARSAPRRRRPARRPEPPGRWRAGTGSP